MKSPGDFKTSLFTACSLLHPTIPQESGEVGGRRERLSQEKGPPYLGDLDSFPLFPLDRRRDPSLHPTKLLPPIPDLRNETGSGLLCEMGISESRTVAVFGSLLLYFDEFLNQWYSTRSFYMCVFYNWKPCPSTAQDAGWVKLTHPAFHPPPHSHVSLLLPVSKRHFLKSAHRTGS